MSLMCCLLCRKGTRSEVENPLCTSTVDDYGLMAWCSENFRHTSEVATRGHLGDNTLRSSSGGQKCYGEGPERYLCT